MRHPLLDEAILVSTEIKGAVFVGAIAVFLHTKVIRGSEDLDLAIASLPPDEELEKIGYTTFLERGKKVRRTPPPRRYKIDVFTEDVNGIPVTTIIETSEEIIVDRKGTKLRAAALELLLLMKFKTAREQDKEDLRVLVQEKYADINWEFMKSICENDYQYQDMRMTLKQFSDT